MGKAMMSTMRAQAARFKDISAAVRAAKAAAAELGKGEEHAHRGVIEPAARYRIPSCTTWPFADAEVTPPHDCSYVDVTALRDCS